MLIAEDVTEILRSNRLEAWGEMARQVAHEIKNPLTPIQLTAEHLRAVADRQRSEPVRRSSTAAVDNILRQVVTLRETSKEFSDYASLRRCSASRSICDTCSRTSRRATPKAASAASTFAPTSQPSTPETFSGDARLLRGAIANLIENAFQAAPGGRVRLASYGVDSKVVISVDDNGPGVAPEAAAENLRPLLLHEILRHRPRPRHHAQSDRRARRPRPRRESQSRLPHIIGAPGSLK